MATYESSQFSHGVWGTVSDAEYRAWGSACDAAIGNALTYVSGSGVNWTTTTVPGTASTWNDYKVYKFNDGNTEIYLKFEWGRGNTSAASRGQLALRVTIGKDSAFVNAAASSYILSGDSAAQSDWQWLSSFTDGCFVLTTVSAQYSTGGYSPAAVVVERTRDYDGSVNNDGAVMLMTGMAVNSTTVGQHKALEMRRIHFSPFAASSTTGFGYVDPNLVAMNSNVDSAGPVYWAGAVGKMYQSRALTVIKNSSLAEWSNVTVNVNGTNRAYRSTSSAASWVAAYGTYRSCFRWE